MKSGFIVYHDIEVVLDALTNEQAGKLFKSLVDYAARREVVHTDDDVVRFCLLSIRATMDRDNEKYESICERNRKNGPLGGRPKTNQCEPKKPTGLSGIKNNPDAPDIDTGIGIDSDTVFKDSEHSEAEPSGDKPKSAKAEPKDPKPTPCPPDLWERYLRISRGFHTDKATQLGARAPFTDAKVLDGAKALDSLIRIKGRPEEEVLAVLGWSIEDPFWSTNLRSIKALLKNSSSNGELKYSNVLTAMTRDLERRAERSMTGNG